MKEPILALIKYVAELEYMDGTKAQNEFSEIEILEKFKKVNEQIKIKKIENIYCKLYYKEEYVGAVNYPEYLQLRIDIKERCKQEPEWKGYKHYTLVYEGKEVKIDKNGETSDNDDLFDYVKYLIKLV